jgi:alpha-tubulin suppressor-like RCC1 family protein
MATKKPVTDHLILTATGPGGTKAKKIKVTVNPGAGTPPPLTGATSVVSDTYTSCALLASGGVDCWGDGIAGDLGNGGFAESALPVHVVGVGGTGTLSGVVALASSGTVSYCALLASGGVDCWGYGAEGELGNSPNSQSAPPVRVVGVGGTGTLSGVASLSGSYRRGTYCAVLGSGGVDCWGNGGALGNGSFSNSGAPVQVTGVGGAGTLSGVASLAASQLSFCAVLTSGGVDCWGSGYNGDLGDASSSNSAFPVQVVGVGGTDTLAGVTSLTASLNSYCALVPSVGVDCWGDDAVGELGNGSVSAMGSAIPVAVSGVGNTGTLTGVISVATDGASYCVVLSSGGVDCWGGGPLGNGSTGQSSSPVAVSDVGGSGTLAGVTSLGASAPGTVCALLTSGGVDCWGYSIVR